jgi:hypothetical protein
VATLAVLLGVLGAAVLPLTVRSLDRAIRGLEPPAPARELIDV